MGIARWHKVGMLKRELALYHRLANHVKAISFITYGGTADENYRDELGSIQLLPSRFVGSNLATFYMLWAKHRKSLRQIDVIKTNQVAGGEIAIKLRRQLGCRLIARCGYLASLFAEKSNVSRRILSRIENGERRLYDEADVGVVTTEHARNVLLKKYDIDPEKIYVIPNYVDVNLFYQRKKVHAMSESLRILFVGRLHPQKNLANLIEAIGILKNQACIPMELVIIGTGPLEETLKRLSARLGISATFLGNMSHDRLPGEMQKSDIFVLPSFYEGHPKALLEAMSSGLPCVGANVRGIREEIKHGETGYLCGTESEEIAEGIAALLESEHLRTTLGDKARKHAVVNYSLDRVLTIELEVFRKARNN